MLASYVLSRTLVPILIDVLVKNERRHGHDAGRQAAPTCSAVSTPASSAGSPIPPRLCRPAARASSAHRADHAGCRRLDRGVRRRPVHVRRHGLLPADRCRADDAACARAVRHAHRAGGTDCSSRSRTRSARWCRATRSAPIIDNIGLPASNYNFAFGNGTFVAYNDGADPGLAEAGPRLDLRLSEAAARGPAAALSGRDLLFPARRHHHPDPGFRRAVADRRAGQRPPRRQGSAGRPDDRQQAAAGARRGRRAYAADHRCAGILRPGRPAARRANSA